MNTITSRKRNELALLDQNGRAKSKVGIGHSYQGSLSLKRPTLYKQAT